MRIPRIHIDQAIDSSRLLTLNPAASHYVSTVLRMKVGRELVLFNGDGKDYSANVIAATKKAVEVDVGESLAPDVESSLNIELACCLIKNDRMDWLLQKATELGVSSFRPLYSKYTDIKIPSDRLSKKIDHWRQVIISACEQSGRTRIPEVHSPLALDPWLEFVDASQRWVLHPYDEEGDENKKQSIKKLTATASSSSDIVLLVGPEGGLSEQEIDLARDNQFQPISLGPRILRAETAPLAAISIIQYQLGDF